MHRVSAAIWSLLVVGAEKAASACGAGLPIVLVAVAVAGAGAFPAFAACNKAITVSEQVQMAFGTIAPNSTGGPITLSPSGGESAGFGFVLLGGSSPATFRVTGTNNCAVNISFAAGNLQGTGSATGGQAMIVNNFTTNAGPNPTLRPPGGQLSFSVGATLIVNPAQRSGPYSGTYSITVTY